MNYETLTETLLLHTTAHQAMPFLVVIFLTLAFAGLIFHGYTLKHAYKDMKHVKEELERGTRGYVHAHMIAAEYHVAKARAKIIAQTAFFVTGFIGVLSERPRGDDIVFIIHVLLVIVVALILYTGILDNIERQRLLEQNLEDINGDVTEE